jgi:hypothetical protein
MPASHSNLRKKQVQDEWKWTCGGMRFIRHVELIARGGFGEVHKVWLP